MSYEVKFTAPVPAEPIRPAHILNEEEFKLLPEVEPLVTSLRSRVWNEGATLEVAGAAVTGQPQTGGDLNLRSVLAGMRGVERGEIKPPIKRSWKIFSVIINRRLGEPGEPPLLLPWAQNIHRRLKEDTPAKGYAILRLQREYEDLHRTWQH